MRTILLLVLLGTGSSLSGMGPAFGKHINSICLLETYHVRIPAEGQGLTR
jgi:hypothetical protein